MVEAASSCTSPPVLLCSWLPSMLSSRLIPTRLIDPSPRPRLVIADARPPSRLRTLSVMFAMLGFLGALAMLRLKGELDSGAAGRLLRERFEELGGLWLKA